MWGTEWADKATSGKTQDEFDSWRETAIRQAIKGCCFHADDKRLWYFDFISYVIISHQEFNRTHLWFPLTFNTHFWLRSQVCGICLEAQFNREKTWIVVWPGGKMVDSESWLNAQFGVLLFKGKYCISFS